MRRSRGGERSGPLHRTKLNAPQITVRSSSSRLTLVGDHRAASCASRHGSRSPRPFPRCRVFEIGGDPGRSEAMDEELPSFGVLVSGTSSVNSPHAPHRSGHGPAGGSLLRSNPCASWRKRWPTCGATVRFYRLGDDCLRPSKAEALFLGACLARGAPVASGPCHDRPNHVARFAAQRNIVLFSRCRARTLLFRSRLYDLSFS